MTRANAEQLKHTPWFAKAGAACIRALSNAWCFEGKSQVFKWASCGDSGPPQSINGSTASRLAEAKKSYVFRR